MQMYWSPSVHTTTCASSVCRTRSHLAIPRKAPLVEAPRYFQRCRCVAGRTLKLEDHVVVAFAQFSGHLYSSAFPVVSFRGWVSWRDRQPHLTVGGLLLHPSSNCCTGHCSGVSGQKGRFDMSWSGVGRASCAGAAVKCAEWQVFFYMLIFHSASAGRSASRWENLAAQTAAVMQTARGLNTYIFLQLRDPHH